MWSKSVECPDDRTRSSIGGDNAKHSDAQSHDASFAGQHVL
jgi:hypothetical protein